LLFAGSGAGKAMRPSYMGETKPQSPRNNTRAGEGRRGGRGRRGRRGRRKRIWLGEGEESGSGAQKAP